MKHEFSYYYPPAEDFFIELWNNALIILDANILCNLYRYDINTRNDFISLLKEFREKLWLPHQSVLEYQRNRLNEIIHQQEKLLILKAIVEKSENIFNQEINKYSKQFTFFDISSIKDDAKHSFSEIKLKIKELEGSEINFLDNDTIREEITDLYNGKVGEKFDLIREQEICEEGEIRYVSQIPPGYKDDSNKKGKHRFGDLILWFQIIEKAKEARSPIIFITDDRKEDWWWIIKNQNFGPRPELIEEINEKSKVNFHMYNSTNFLKWASHHIHKQLDSATLKEVESVRKERIYPFPQQYLFDQISDVIKIVNKLPLEEIMKYQIELARIAEMQEYQREQILSSVSKIIAKNNLIWPFYITQAIQTESEEDQTQESNEESNTDEK